MLIALPTMHVRVTAEAVACRSISIFARCVSGSLFFDQETIVRHQFHFGKQVERHQAEHIANLSTW